MRPCQHHARLIGADGAKADNEGDQAEVAEHLRRTLAALASRQDSAVLR